MQMTHDVGPPPTAAGSLEVGVDMPASLAIDVGTVNTAGCSQTPGSPTIHVCCLCMTKTPDIWLTTQL